VREDILFQELRELRTAQTALNKSLDALFQLLTELLHTLCSPRASGCQCHSASPPPPSNPSPTGETIYSLEQAAEFVNRSVQVVRGWCREIEDEEDAAERRSREQQLYDMERQGVPQNRRHLLLKPFLRAVGHTGGNEKGPWEITPAGLLKLRALDNVRPRLSNGTGTDAPPRPPGEG
jgi:hypothetical protein